MGKQGRHQVELKRSTTGTNANYELINIEIKIGMVQEHESSGETDVDRVLSSRGFTMQREEEPWM